MTRSTSHLSSSSAARKVVRKKERGYVLLTLIFFVAVLAISLTTILPSIIHEAKRDREEELVHRGAQYTRAIRLYFKKNGRYPAKVEDLENSNNIRYLRKRYKDPMSRGENGEQADFKILHFGDPSVQLQQGGQIPPPGLVPQAKPGSLPTDPTKAGGTVPVKDPAAADSSSDPNAATPAADATAAAAGSGDSAGGNNGDSPSSPAGESFGGGAMVGVVSLSHRDSIREFNKKHHYHEWQFMYDQQDRSLALPSGPWQPQKFPGIAGTGQPNLPGQPANPPAGPADPGANPNPNPQE